MTDWTENAYNLRLPRGAPRMKVWRSAGLLLTYRCNAACEFCYYCCGPEKGGLMPVEMALAVWRSLRVLAGDRARVHLTGGEPFLYWARLVEILGQAACEGLGPAHMVETNGYWATDPDLIRDRVSTLDSLGVGVLKVSCDPFHQAFVPIENIRLLVGIAQQLLGPQRVQVRWRQYLDTPLRPDMEGYVRSILQRPCRFNGRAACGLAQVVASMTMGQLEGQGCLAAFLGAKGVHVDPYGNVFSGTCSGIVIGNVSREPLDLIWSRFDPQAPGLIGLLAARGPAAILQMPEAAGYRPLPLYADKCHLCWQVRSHMARMSAMSQVLGPRECYQ